MYCLSDDQTRIQETMTGEGKVCYRFRRICWESPHTGKESLQCHQIGRNSIDEFWSRSPRDVAVGGILPAETFNHVVGPAGFAITGLAWNELVWW